MYAGLCDGILRLRIAGRDGKGHDPMHSPGGLSYSLILSKVSK